MDNTPIHKIQSPPLIRVLQINLQRGQAPSRQLNTTVQEQNIDIALIQEPYVFKDRVCGLASSARVIAHHSNPKTAIAVFNKDLSIFNITTVSSQYTTAIDITLATETITIVSAYIPPPSRTPSDDDRDFIAELNETITKLNRKKIIIGTDSNSKSESWGHQYEDPRGRAVRDIISSHSLHLHNDGLTATFHNESGAESFIDLTISSNALARRINNWMVSEESSLSDHRYIFFDISLERSVTNIMSLTNRYNTSIADWDTFSDTLTTARYDIRQTIDTARNQQDINVATEQLTKLLINAADISIPLKRIGTNSKSWWSAELTTLRHQVNRLRRHYQRTQDTQLRDTRRNRYLEQYRHYKTQS